MENRPPKPPSYLAIAIISTILCCLPAGIVSIVYATKVNDAYFNEDYEGAQRASNNAKTWAIVSIVVALAGLIIYIAIFGFAFFAALANS
ncbi:CD225/dispanin family protein [Paucihalobacter ruber]|uniref:CD225/dispanin family protein n=1 Tax=Paucihalobacter ruber TaxID=2567861 RepID=A0A506PHB8_9FLAO|nr:CD225/dispanin family protein [Paucihalobacter ruber]TPV32482.1 CD225/dispanin family protein [Paucihalobacter ruber]